jgi:hypothetical protein
MRDQRLYQIHYQLKNAPISFFQPDRNMTDADAWHYACLHAGIGVLHNLANGQDELLILIRHAKRLGLEGVWWEELD